MSIRKVVSTFGKWIQDTFAFVIVLGFICILCLGAYLKAVEDIKLMEQASIEPSQPSVDIDIVDGLVMLRDGPRIITIRTTEPAGEAETTASPFAEPSKPLVDASGLLADAIDAVETRQ